MKTKDRQLGISLIEVLFIFLIIGIIAAVTVPNLLTATRSYKLLSASNALSQQLNNCRQLAVRENLFLKIRILNNQSQIDIDRDDDFDSDDSEAVTISQQATITPVTPTDGIVTFTSRGEIPNLTATPVFRVTFNNRQRLVTVNARGVVTVGTETSVTS